MASYSRPKDALRIPESSFEVDPDGDMLVVLDYSCLNIKNVNCDMHDDNGRAAQTCLPKMP